MTTRRQHLAELRRSLGYNQESLAEVMGTDRSTVSRWECGKCEPLPFIRPKLAKILKVTPAELDILLHPSGEEQPPSHSRQKITGLVTLPSNLDLGESDEMNRRELLRLLSVAGTLVALPPRDSANTDRAIASAPLELDQYEQLNAHLWQVFGLSQSKRLVYPVVSRQLRVLTAALEQTRNLAAHRRLCTLTGDLFQLAGEILFDSDRYSDAAHCYTLAADAGKQAGAHDLWACALTRHAFISLSERRFPQAASILSAAARVANRGDRRLATRHWVATVQAQAFAGMGDLTACERALDTADHVTMLTGPLASSGWLRFDGSRLAEERGTCYRELGRTDRAGNALTEAMGHTMSLRRRASILTDLAMLGLQRHDLDEVLHHGETAIALAEQTQSTGYVGRKLQNLQQQLGAHASDHRVAQFAERIARLPGMARP
ncbi:helix-turn-helix domain-containing protein [Nonomuraea sp. NPDC050394]|uniref:helix-turn-helix domain-containing protein n=1 Tax=Nonomuraea sp. NPDC050394 TaxID=3364363 RepID=UPI00379A0E07